jgi:hypothetical protein
MPETTNTNALRDSVPPTGNLPFFARFLEGQDREERSAMTLKYPSDRDEDIDPILDAPNTNSNTLQAAPERRMTLKYPSDRDEWWDSRES